MAQSADLIVTNANVLTVDAALPRARAVAIRGNKIAFVGRSDDVGQWRGSATRVIDGHGNTLMPGIVDAHYHLLVGSVDLGNIQLGDVKSLDDLAKALHAFVQAHPQQDAYSGSHLQYTILPVDKRLTRQDLDAIVSDRPLTLMAFDYHTVWANTRALEIAGVLYGAETGPNSEIVMGPDGLATGELREPAAYCKVLVHFDAWARTVKGLSGETFGKPRLNPQRERMLVREGLRLAAQFGITSVHNMDGDDEQASFFAALEDAGELTVRVNIPFGVRPDTEPKELDEAVVMMHNYQSDMVRSGRVKFFLDGVAESWTAFLLEDYADRPGWNGEALYSAEHFNRMAVECDRKGLQISVHAIGDAAARRTLDGLEYAQQVNGRRDSRHRIEHIELIHPDDLPRFARLGAIASMQPLHAPIAFPASGELWPLRIGQERWHRGFAWQYIRGAGAKLIFGSDWPVVTQNPFLGLHAALNRPAWRSGLPDHRQSLEDAIASYTRDAAYAEFQEQVKGQLRVGFLADMVLLSADLEKILPEDIKDVTPALTICDGRIVFEALFE